MRIGKIASVVLGLLIVAAPSFAGIGIHINFDQTTIEEETSSFTFPDDPPGYPQSTLTRTESTAPIGAGIDLTLNILPVFDFQLSIEAAFAEYDVVFTPPTISGQDPVEEEGVPYMRVGADLTALYNVFKIPTTRIFVGGGLSAGVLAPVMSEALLVENISSADEEVVPEDLISTEFKFGFHLMAGVGFKPPVLPLGVRVYAKYYMMSGVDEPAPASWVTLGAGIYFGG